MIVGDAGVVLSIPAAKAFGVQAPTTSLTRSEYHMCLGLSISANGTGQFRAVASPHLGHSVRLCTTLECGQKEWANICRAGAPAGRTHITSKFLTKSLCSSVFYLVFQQRHLPNPGARQNQDLTQLLKRLIPDHRSFEEILSGHLKETTFVNSSVAARLHLTTEQNGAGPAQTRPKLP